MTGIPSGEHVVKVELAEKWKTGEILAHASKSVVVQYTPVQRRPIRQGSSGAKDRWRFSDYVAEEKELHESLEKGHRDDLNTKRDKY